VEVVVEVEVVERGSEEQALFPASLYAAR
jgi:hypothetical protein